MGLFGGKQLNLIIGFNTTENLLVIMRVVGNDVSSCKADYISVDPALIINGEWAQIISDYLPEYIENQHFDKTFAVYLLMPDRLVSTDVLTVPTLARSKMESALQSQIEELYSFASGYKFNKLMLSTNKSNSTYELIMINKDLMNSIYKALSASKLYVKNCTHAASGALNAVFALRPKTRKQNFLFLDIKGLSSRISVCANGVTIGWVNIPFGLNFLANDKILIEANVVYNDVANIAVINATEIARKKKVTVFEEEEEDSVIEEAAITVNEISAGDLPAEEDIVAARANLGADNIDDEGDTNSNTSPDITSTTDSVTTTDGTDNSANTTSPDGASNVALADSTATVVSEPKEPPKPKVKAYTRKNKRLPAILQRPLPETPEGFLVENFRAFVKRCLLVKMQNEQSGYLPVPTFVLVNMPDEYGFIIDEINKEEDSGIEFRFFDPNKEKNLDLTNNLELYGALFTNMFNKVNNF